MPLSTTFSMVCSISEDERLVVHKTRSTRTKASVSSNTGAGSAATISTGPMTTGTATTGMVTSAASSASAALGPAGCTSTTSEKGVCPNQTATATVVMTTITSTASIDCGGCGALTTATILGICAVSLRLIDTKTCLKQTKGLTRSSRNF